MKTILALLALFFITGCACWTPEHRNDPGCVVVHQIVDCSEASVLAVAPQFKPIVLALIAKATGADGQVDWNQVYAAFGGLGIKDGGCILADIENDFLTKASASPASAARAKSFHEGFNEYRNEHWKGVQFKFIVDGKEVLR